MFASGHGGPIRFCFTFRHISKSKTKIDISLTIENALLLTKRDNDEFDSKKNPFFREPKFTKTRMVSN